MKLDLQIEEILSRCVLDYRNDDGKITKENMYLVKWISDRKNSWLHWSRISDNSYVMQTYRTHF